MTEQLNVKRKTQEKRRCGELECLPRMWTVGFSNPNHDRPKWLKQVVAAPLPNARH